LTTKLLLERPGNFEFALELLNSGCPIALPTETVYGLAARMDLPKAVTSVFQLKNRPHFDPLIVHVSSPDQVAPWVKKITPLQKKLMDRFWPGPLTLLFEKSDRVSDLITAGTEWVAVRSPRHPIFQKFLNSLSVPLVAPSANRFTSVSPTRAQDVLDELGSWGLEAVVDGGPCAVGLESTVLRVTEGSPPQIEILRPGAIGTQELQNCLGPEISMLVNPRGTGAASPGTHALHYSPGLPAQFFESEESLMKRASEIATQDLILIEVIAGSLPKARALPWKSVLSLGKNPEEAAQNVFRVLRDLKPSGGCGFIAVAGEAHGIGLAINDRLRRSAGRG
jgi:L-threonylcarbamoyladenylate synthase